MERGEGERAYPVWWVLVATRVWYLGWVWSRLGWKGRLDEGALGEELSSEREQHLDETKGRENPMDEEPTPKENSSQVSVSIDTNDR